MSDGPSGPEPGRPPLPGPGRRREAARSAALPRVDRPQRLRPGRHPDRAVRMDDGPAPLPCQPHPGPELRQVPGADRDPALPAVRGARRDHVLALRPTAAGGSHPGRHAGRDDPHGDRPGNRLHDARRPADRPGLGHRGLHVRRRQEARRPDHRGAQRSRLPRLREPAEAGRPPPHRPERPGAVERAPAPLLVHDRGRRGGSHLAAAGLGGLDGRGLGGVRPRPRHDRGPEPRRRRGDPPSCRPTPPR